MRYCALALLVACYSASPHVGVPCPNNELCPIGQVCSQLTQRCELEGSLADITTHELTIVRSGNVGGTVTSTPSGIDCGSDCSDAFPEGSAITLTAIADEGGVFASWTGVDCGKSDVCTVDLDADLSIEAMFLLNNSVGVSMTGNGVGTVISVPSGIDCPGVCSNTFAPDENVELTATPGNESNFTGWSVDCTGMGPCSVLTDTARSVTATFTLQRYNLSVAKAGNGAGTVTGGGINCGSTCTQTYDSGTMVTLTATPATGSTFTGWSASECPGTGSCTITMTAARTVTATFTLTQHDLTVSKAGTGLGTVTASSINCGATCTATYNYGTVVGLTATPDPSSIFIRYSGGGCGTTSSCNVTITTATTVTATFMPSRLSCNSGNNTSSCSNGTIPEINLGNISASQCHDMCETAMPQKEMASGCWFKAGDNNCYCRSGSYSGGGGKPGGRCF